MGLETAAGSCHVPELVLYNEWYLKIKHFVITDVYF